MKQRIRLSSAQIILLGFLITILIGSALLSLPVCSATGKRVPYIDALFTATTSVCVTGLVTLPVSTTWSFFGQIIILLLIQIGGFGIITVVSGLMLAIKNSMRLRSGILIQDAYNLNSLSGIKSFLKKAFLIYQHNTYHTITSRFVMILGKHSVTISGLRSSL